MRLIDELNTRLLFFDGGMGTMLQKAGLPAGTRPEIWNLERPQSVRAVHEAYLRAGCDIITANTFGASGIAHGAEKSEELCRAGLRIAKDAVKAIGRGYTAFDIGPLGQLLQPLGELAFEDAVQAFSRMAEIAKQEGAELVIIETMTDLRELKAAMLGVREACDLPIVASFTLEANGRLLTGADVRGAAAMLEGLGACALGLNCGYGPSQMLPFAKELSSATTLPLLFMPNAGMPDVGGKTAYLSPEDYTNQCVPLLECGAALLGGCCGTTPAHMEALIARCRGEHIIRRDVKPPLTVCSHSKTVVFDSPVVIGERLNPTGKKRLKQALAERDFAYILQEGLAQAREGAQVLDVNAGAPGVDERVMLKDITVALQSVCDLPLQIDTAKPDALEGALRAYAGKPIINSVNGSKESLEAVLPLAKKYGCALVALPLDEQGVPDTAQGRLGIAQRILSAAAAYGIGQNEFLFDALTMPVSASPDAARVTLETLRLFKEKLGVRTILGVSNISFGLPERGELNAAFYTMALQSGLDAGIINPHEARMRRAHASALALLGGDARFERYIAGCEKAEQTQAAQDTPLSLYDAVLSGLSEQAARLANELLQTLPPLALIDEHLIPALNAVGEDYEKGRKYLPQLLMTAEAAKAAFAAINAHWAKSGQTRASHGAVVLATVRGDVHDIGKNIARALLTNYGFDVTDLGKDVPSDDIVKAALATGAKLVGLSALMTTTLPAMEEAIRALRARVPHVHIMVGGAVLTEEYAKTIGADDYAKNAMVGVAIAQKVYS